MLNSVILTVKVEGEEVTYDMEFPANVPAGDLCDRLLVVFKSIDAEAFRDVERITLRMKRSGKLIGDEETLESAEVWDGSIVTVIK